ncbi:hypothetical protein M3149_22875, partial [Hydrogenophaga intermedia]|nr:hypothetical protein [Hydrogenophaga intermedia]
QSAPAVPSSPPQPLQHLRTKTSQLPSLAVAQRRLDSAPAAEKKAPVKKAGKGAIMADKEEKPAKAKTAGGRVAKAAPKQAAAATKTRSLRSRAWKYG